MWRSNSLSPYFTEDKSGDITVYDADVSAFVVLSQRHGGSLGRCHYPNCAGVVRALQVGLGSQRWGLDAQGLRKGEGLLHVVSTVGLVPPLHHRELDGGRLVLTREDHGLEEDCILLFLLHWDMHTVTHAHWWTHTSKKNKAQVLLLIY